MYDVHCAVNYNLCKEHEPERSKGNFEKLLATGRELIRTTFLSQTWKRKKLTFSKTEKPGTHMLEARKNE
jgi:hypothetical protein